MKRGKIIIKITSWAKLSLNIILAITIISCGFSFVLAKYAVAKEKKELVVLTVGGSWQKSTHEFLGKAFSEKYGVKLVYDIRPNTEQLIALQARKKNPVANIMELSGSRLAKATIMGLIAKQDEISVPNRKWVPKQFKTDYWTGRCLAPIVLVFNKEKVDEEDCNSWDVLTNPKYKKKVALMKYGWMGEYFLHAINLLKGGTYTDITPGIRFCRNVIENGGKILQSNDHAMRVLTSGEVWVAPYWTGRTQGLIKKGVPLKYKFVPGSIGYVTGFSVVNNAKNIDLAYKYVDMSLDPDVQTKYAVKFSYAPTNSRVVLPPEASKARFAKENIDNIIGLDYVAIAKGRDKNLERFNIEILR